MAGPEDKDAPALVVGLGNPGEPYRGTRHNIGFEVVDRLASAVRGGEELGVAGGRLLRGRLRGRAILLLWPLLYMNRSGRPTADVVRRFDLAADRILVVSDDLDLDLGRIRVRRGGKSGGHNGVADLIAELGTEGFQRLRLGIGRPPPGVVAERYVLEPFAAEERPVAASMAERGAEAARCWRLEGVLSAMNRYNAPSPGAGTDRAGTESSGSEAAGTGADPPGAS